MMCQARSIPGSRKSFFFVIALCCAPLACSSPTETNSRGTGGSGNGGTRADGPATGGDMGIGGKVATGGGGGGTLNMDSGSGTGGRTGGGGGAGGSSGAGGSTGTGGTTGGGGGAGGTTGGGGGTGGLSGAGGLALCPPGITETITVAKDGSGQFTTVQAAVNSVSSGSTARIRIDIKSGTYTEKLTIADRSNLCLVGADAMATILAYGDQGTSGAESVLISASDFSAANLTMQNTFGTGAQAVAVRTTGQRQQFLNCRFIGFQDTLYTHSGSQYFRDCYVQGNTDYVFGAATAVLQNCEIRNVEGGTATSAPSTVSSTAYGIVFLGGKFTADPKVKAQSVALARPWRPDGFAAFINAELGAHISAVGFVSMSGNPPEKARFHEHGSTGSSANTSSRASYQLTASEAASYTLANIFGNWTPTYSQ